MTVLLFALESPTIIILVVAAIFLLFGGSKLPQLAKALGQSKKAFKDGMDEADRDDRLKPIRARSLMQSMTRRYLKKHAGALNKDRLRRAGRLSVRC